MRPFLAKDSKLVLKFLTAHAKHQNHTGGTALVGGFDVAAPCALEKRDQIAAPEVLVAARSARARRGSASEPIVSITRGLPET